MASTSASTSAYPRVGDHATLRGRSRVIEGGQPRRLGTGQRPQVGRIGPDHHVEGGDHVGQPPGHRALGRQVLPVRRLRSTARHPTERGLHARQAAARRRDADRPAAVGSGGQRHHARGDGGRAPSGGAARCVVEVPRIEGGAEHGVVGVRLPSELRRVGLAHHHASGGHQTGHQRRVATGPADRRRRPASRGW